LSLGILRVTFTLDVEPVAKHELEATLAAREELGPVHDDQLVAGFLERIDREIDRRVDERVAKRVPAKRRSTPLHPANLALCIPIIAVAGGVGGGFPGVLIAIVALAAIFLYAESHR
jgi:hypothetical protein